MKGLVAVLFGIMCMAQPLPSRGEEPWPDLPPPSMPLGGGERDAAVVVGIENYFFVEPVPGAVSNANDWQAHLTAALGVPSERVALLRDDDATSEKIRLYAEKMAAEVEPRGTLWFVFIGHGAPSKNGRDGLLVGVDAQQRADSLQERSIARAELLGLLAKGRQDRTVVLLDACFSGRSPSGRALVTGLQPLLVPGGLPEGIDARTILLTGARSDQFAGPLPKSKRMRPAFSYLALGALRGWASDGEGEVTAAAVVRYSGKALRLAKDRTQTPELAAGPATTVLGRAWESGPDLKKIARGLGAAARRRPRRGQIGKAGIEWIRIHGGSFLMGSEDIRDAGPVHRVSMPSFEMAKAPVTFKQYRACVEAGACTPPSEGFKHDDQPVTCLDWHQAKSFSEWVGGRLPSESEWEYAARSGGKNRKHPWGNEAPTCERAVISEGGDACGRKPRTAWPVCSKPKGDTDQGLCDMAGNVSQWVEDRYLPDYLGAPDDGRPRPVSSGQARVVRGGSWLLGPAFAQSTRRQYADPSDRSACDRGFRPARSLP